MADIFLSYAREDREAARRLAEELEGLGWSLWWDRELLAGEAFDRVIEAELAAARCVVVLWSEAAIGSDWVRAEAHEGMARGILVPTKLDGATPPMPFRQLHAVELADWARAAQPLLPSELAQTLRNRMGRPSQAPSTDDPVSAPRTSHAALTSDDRRLGTLDMLVIGMPTFWAQPVWACSDRLAQHMGQVEGREEPEVAAAGRLRWLGASLLIAEGLVLATIPLLLSLGGERTAIALLGLGGAAFAASIAAFLLQLTRLLKRHETREALREGASELGASRVEFYERRMQEATLLSLVIVAAAATPALAVHTIYRAPVYFGLTIPALIMVLGLGLHLWLLSFVYRTLGGHLRRP